ncbi:MAG: TetR/AcrR family transcriptional regulator [Pseudomonadota bacterium]
MAASEHLFEEGGEAPDISGPEPGPARGMAELAILEAAAECFSERGFTATSVDEVARRMGYTKGRVYHYFRSKGELFIAAASHGLDRLVAEVWPAHQAPGSDAERLAAMARAHVNCQMRDIPYHRVMLQGVTLVLHGATTPDERDLLAQFAARQRNYEQVFAKVISAGQTSGSFAPGNLVIATKTFLLTLNGSCFWFSRRDDQSAEELEAIAEQMVRQAIWGLNGGG